MFDPAAIRNDIISMSIPEPNSGCWLWLYRVSKRGYAMLSRPPLSTQAHRLSYMAFVGEIPAGLQIDHLCRVRSCVNPTHLEPVTNRENQRRGIGLIARQLAMTECNRGHPFSGDNLFIDAKGHRRCRACWRENAAAYNKRKASR